MIQQESLLTPTQFAWLEDIGLNDPYNMGPLALQVLMSLAGYEPDWTDYEVPAELRSMQVSSTPQKQHLFVAYPNPVSDFITIKCNEVANDIVLLEIQSVDGRTVAADRLNTGQSELSIITDKMAEGAYMIVFRKQDGSLIDKVQFIKI